MLLCLYAARCMSHKIIKGFSATAYDILAVKHTTYIAKNKLLH